MSSLTNENLRRIVITHPALCKCTDCEEFRDRVWEAVNDGTVDDFYES